MVCLYGASGSERGSGTLLQKKHGNSHFVKSRETKARKLLHVNKSTSRGSFLNCIANSVMRS